MECDIFCLRNSGLAMLYQKPRRLVSKQFCKR